MSILGLSRREAEHIIEGCPTSGRDDLDEVRSLAAFMRATGQVEPAPPMSVDLICQIDAGDGPATD